MHPLVAQPINLGTLTGDLLVSAGETIVHGWSFVETTGGAGAEIQLWDGPVGTGTLVVDVTLTGGESTRDWLAGAGIGTSSDLTAHVVSGSVGGSVWIVPAYRFNDYALGLAEAFSWAGVE